MTAAPWADEAWSPFGVPLDPEPGVDAEWPFGEVAAPVDVIDEVNVVDYGPSLHGMGELEVVGTQELESVAVDDFATAQTFDTAESFLAALGDPVVDDTGAPVIEWEPATREQLGDGDTVRVTQVGRWKGTRLVGKTTHYERKTS